MNQETVKMVIGTASGLVVGGFVGYIVTRRVLVEKYEALLDTEVERIKKFYKGQAEEPEVVPSEESYISKEEIIRRENLGKQSELIAELGYDNPSVGELMEDEDPFRDNLEKVKEGLEEEEPELDERGVPTHSKSGIPVPPLMDPLVLDYKSEEFLTLVANRTREEPYVISVDEFMDDHPEFEKQTLTYFEGDDTLCDSRDEVIPDIEDVVGNDALTMFGQWSKDSDIVYVRNERIASDFEVAYDERTYIEAIAGFKYRKVHERMKEDD